jgi:hypothetical protein
VFIANAGAFMLRLAKKCDMHKRAMSVLVMPLADQSEVHQNQQCKQNARHPENYITYGE